MQTISITAAAFAILAIGTGSALAVQFTAPSRGGPDGSINESCMYNMCDPNPNPDPHPQPGKAGPDNVRIGLTCDVRDTGLVFHNLGDLAIDARTKLAWSVSDGQSGRVQLATPMSPRSSVLYAGIRAEKKASCTVSPV